MVIEESSMILEQVLVVLNEAVGSLNVTGIKKVPWALEEFQVVGYY